MACLLKGVSLPFAGYGHVILGGPGPILMYDLGGQSIRVMADVPVERWEPSNRMALLERCYAPLLPPELRAAFVEALRAREMVVAANEIRPRTSYGAADRVLIGDAAGNYHPMTAVGLTLGFGDALALAEGGDFEQFVAGRIDATRAPELLAMGLYEVFADHRAESVSLRQTVYRRWRTSPAIRERTVAMLACEDTSASRLSMTFAGLVARALAAAVPQSLGKGNGQRAGATVKALFVRLAWLARGVVLLGNARRVRDRDGEAQVRAMLARAFLRSMPARRHRRAKAS